MVKAQYDYISDTCTSRLAMFDQSRCLVLHKSVKSHSWIGDIDHNVSMDEYIQSFAITDCSVKK